MAEAWTEQYAVAEAEAEATPAGPVAEAWRSFRIRPRRLFNVNPGCCSAALRFADLASGLREISVNFTRSCPPQLLLVCR